MEKEIKIRIRTIQESDYPAVLRLMNQVQELHTELRPDIYRPCEETISEEAFRAHLGLDTFYVAELDGQVVGAMEIEYMHRTRPKLVERKVLYIHCIVVDANHRGQGIGKMLLDFVQELKRGHNLDAIELQVNARNQRAYEVYKRYGFTEKSVNLEL